MSLKVGATSLESTFEKLTKARRPLCSKRFVGSFATKPVAVHKAKAVQFCGQKATNLLWGHLSLDLQVSIALSSAPINTMI